MIKIWQKIWGYQEIKPKSEEEMNKFREYIEKDRAMRESSKPTYNTNITKFDLKEIMYGNGATRPATSNVDRRMYMYRNGPSTSSTSDSKNYLGKDGKDKPTTQGPIDVIDSGKKESNNNSNNDNNSKPHKEPEVIIPNIRNVDTTNNTNSNNINNSSSTTPNTEPSGNIESNVPDPGLPDFHGPTDSATYGEGGSYIEPELEKTDNYFEEIDSSTQESESTIETEPITNNVGGGYREGATTSDSFGDGYSFNITSGDKTYNSYVQYDGSYAGSSYGVCNGYLQSFTNYGCGVTCLATIASGNGYNLNPEQIANMYYNGSDPSTRYEIGSYPELVNIANMLFGEGNCYQGGFNHDSIVSTIRNGGEVMICTETGQTYDGEYKNGSSTYYTDSGHWMAIVGVNNDGSKVYISDPGNGTSGWIDTDGLKLFDCFRGNYGYIYINH